MTMVFEHTAYGYYDHVERCSLVALAMDLTGLGVLHS